MATTYIVECSICGQAWEVEQHLLSRPGAWIKIPLHEMLDLTNGEPVGVQCPDRKTPGVGLGSRSAWERDWTRRHSLRTMPTVFGGARVKLVS